MATAWDDLMKLLSGANPQDLVSFLLPDARFMHAADKELKTRTIEADMVYFIEKNGQEAIIHGEYQRYRDKDMGQRLWEYNVLTTCMTRKKVYSFAIYLRPGGTVVEPPHKIDFIDDEVVHIFYYKNIKSFTTRISSCGKFRWNRCCNQEWKDCCHCCHSQKVVPVTKLST